MASSLLRDIYNKIFKTNQKLFEDVEGRYYYFAPIKKNFEKIVK
jgi:hypothetical protein